jgi:hypothetical protein
MIGHNYRDFIIYTDYINGAGKDEKGRAEKYSVRVFDSPVGEGECNDEVGEIDWNRLETWRTALANRKIPDQDLREFAQKMGNMILPRHALDLYRRSRASIEEGEDHLRIRLRLLPELACLPWEYARIEEHEGGIAPNDYWVLDQRISIVRHEAISIPAAPFSIKPYRRVIIAMASPPPYTRYEELNLRDEQNAIKAEFIPPVRGVLAEYYPDFAKEPRSTGTTVDAVQKALRDSADIFHFSGHGKYWENEPIGWYGSPESGVLVFDNGNHTAEEIGADVISSILAEGHVRLVVLNACQTGHRDMFQRWSSVAMALLKRGIPAVVAMQFSVRDDMAAEFARRIYEDLVNELTIDEAVAHGRLAMRRIDDTALDWGCPVLYLRNSGGVIFPSVTDARARLEAAESSLRESTLNETAMGWTRKGVLASADQLEILKKGGNSLKLAPLEALLLVRSALESGQETGYWVEQLRRVGVPWLQQIAGAPLPQTEKDFDQERGCLGLDGRILPPPQEKTEKLALAAVHHPDPKTAQTAALALLALKPEEAVGKIQEELVSIRSGAQRRRRRAMLIGLLAEADPNVDRKLEQTVDNLQDRFAVWGWRARKHLAVNWPKISRWSFGGALGAAVALAVYRSILAVFSTRLVGTEFAVYSYWGFLAGLGLTFGTTLAAPLLLQDHGSIRPGARRRTTLLALLLGAGGFCAAGALTFLLNSYSFQPTVFLLTLGTTFLAGLGLGLGLIHQPQAGWRLGMGGWLKRLAAAGLVLAVLQLPVLCEAAAGPDGVAYLPNLRWLVSPIQESTQSLADKFFFLKVLFPQDDLNAILESKQCCFACGSAAAQGSFLAGLGKGCFVQWLTVLDAALVGLALTVGVTVGMHFDIAAFRDRWTRIRGGKKGI